jgi:uncharacterized protein (TIGR02391 family)
MSGKSSPFKKIVPMFSQGQTESIARVLGDTSDGLKGSEIGWLLTSSRIEDVSPKMTKWKRLYNALVTAQTKYKAGNPVVIFIQRALDPSRYAGNREVFEMRRQGVNVPLILAGMEYCQDGHMRNVRRSATLNEAEERANRLRAKLSERNVHSEVLRFCEAEIIENNYFHAVLEAVKSVTSRIRELSGLTSDGSELVDKAFGLGKHNNPILQINDINTDTTIGEQRGFSNLVKGVYGMVRNPVAHEARIEWNMNEEDALDSMTILSMIHRKLDNTKRHG